MVMWIRSEGSEFFALNFLAHRRVPTTLASRFSLRAYSLSLPLFSSEAYVFLIIPKMSRVRLSVFILLRAYERDHLLSVLLSTISHETFPGCLARQQ